MSKCRKFGVLLSCLAAVSWQAYIVGKEIRPEIRSRKNPVSSSAEVLTKAKDNFEDNCIPCHGDQGKGDGPLAKDLKTRPKDLTSGKELSTMTDGEIYWIITTGNDPMPSFGQKLTDEERWGLVHFVRKMSKTMSGSIPARSVASSGQGSRAVRP